MTTLRFLLLVTAVIFTCCGSADRQTSENKELQKADSLKSQKTVNNKEIVCFVYHRFGDARYPSTNISVADFEAHLEYLKAADFEVMTLGSAMESLHTKNSDKKMAVITIDDGFDSFFENGWPLLKKHHFPATLFINTETVGASSYMDWDELKKLTDGGIEIANHTHSHAYFLNIAEADRYDAFENEVLQCQQLIEKHLGTKAEVFAYPYGEFDGKMKKIIQQLGFKAAAAQNSGVIYAKTDPMALPRFPMSGGYTAIEKFKMKANMHPLKVDNEYPDDFILDTPGQPTFTFSYNSTHLRTNELQCFIQGVECELTVEDSKYPELQVKIKPTSSLHRRRTLYTVTIPDDGGEWHWFSQLWVIPSIED